MKLLFVDDNPITRSMQVRRLTSWGYEVEQARDGEEAWAKLADVAINLVISDWMMPKLSGIDLCRKIRAANREHYIYIILCTSKDQKEDLILGLTAGADDFIVKPIALEELRVRILTALRVLELESKLVQRHDELQRAFAQIDIDLSAAAAMQLNLLPVPRPKHSGTFTEWRFRPSSYVGGDIFNVLSIGSRYLAFYMLDVSGHGVPAAMLSVTLSMVLTPEATPSSILTKYNSTTDSYEPSAPEAAIAELNERFRNLDDQYFTMVYGLLDIEACTIRISQAGHPQPILIRKGGEVVAIGDAGFPVGVWPDAKYVGTEFSVAQGDRLIIYSDGISECFNAAGEQFGGDRILDYLQTNTKLSTLDELLDGLERKMEAWNAGGAKFDDDVSILAIEIIPAREESEFSELISLGHDEVVA